jgi:outer membrane biosynthesis protein TonB
MEPVLPTKQPNYSLLRPQILGILVILLLLVKISISLFTPKNVEVRASDLTVANILNAVNEQRTLRNITTLSTNSKLSWAAQYKADDMQARHYFAHKDPDGNFIWNKIVEAGYTPYSQLGENLAIEFYDTESLVSAWMNSPTHRENLLNQGFKDQGMGLSLGAPSQGQYYSAIANTFGSLSGSTKPKPTPTPKPVPTQEKPSPTPTTLAVLVTPTPSKTPTPTPTPSKTPLPTNTPTPTTTPTPPTPTQVYVPVEIRPTLTVQNTNSNFALPNHNNVSTNTTSTIPTNLEKSTGVVNTVTNNNKNFTINRYLILACGIILLLLALSDIQKAVEQKLEHIDKKINNVVVLIISLIVIAFMYWL